MPRTPTRLAALAAVVALGLAGCGEATEPGAADGAPNAADVSFATGMIPHHAQALDMVKLAEDRPLDPEVRALVDDIAAQQEPEIETMSEWLRSWGEDVPDADASMKEMGEMAMSDGEDGMMTAKARRQLRFAPDPAFEDMWLGMMTVHHQGAVAMAETEIAEGSDPDAIALAERIRSTQTEEIDLMQELVGRD